METMFIFAVLNKIYLAQIYENGNKNGNDIKIQ